MATAFKNAPLLTAEELENRLPEFRAAVEQYNDGYYFESHETLEDLWMVTPLPQRDLFQAVIQLAAAFVHYSRREYPGVLKLLDASAEKLRAFPSEYLGMDVRALLADVERARTSFADLGADAFLAWDEELRPRIVLG